jgi:charged multivesicular body protein 4
MFSFFGKKPEVSPINVIQNMKLTLEMIEKREKFLESNIVKFKNEAKEVLHTNKPKAITLLKKAKMNEKQLSSLYSQKENLELQIFSIEQGVTNKNIINSMKEGKNIIEQMSKNMDPDNIGELMDDITETFQTSNEVTDAISRPISTTYDDDDLLQELELENESHIHVDVEVKKSFTQNIPQRNQPTLAGSSGTTLAGSSGTTLAGSSGTHLKKITKKTDEEELNELMLSMT